MTVLEAIDYIDSIKPNPYDRKVKVEWLSRVEGMVKTNVRLLSFTKPFLAEDLTEALTSAQNGDWTMLAGMGIEVTPATQASPSAFFTAMTGENGFINSILKPYDTGNVSLIAAYADTSKYVANQEAAKQFKPLWYDATQTTDSNATDDRNKMLTAAHPHDKIYTAYLSAMIDLSNGEYNKYQNSLIVFNDFMSEYMEWFARNFRPADGKAFEYGYYLRGSQGQKGDTGDPGQDGSDGQDGVSPTVSVTKSGKVTTVTITDAGGAHSAEINDGEDGVSPSATVTQADGKTTITITDSEGTTSEDIYVPETTVINDSLIPNKDALTFVRGSLSGSSEIVAPDSDHPNFYVCEDYIEVPPNIEFKFDVGGDASTHANPRIVSVYDSNKTFVRNHSFPNPFYMRLSYDEKYIRVHYNYATLDHFVMYDAECDPKYLTLDDELPLVQTRKIEKYLSQRKDGAYIHTRRPVLAITIDGMHARTEEMFEVADKYNVPISIAIPHNTDFVNGGAPPLYSRKDLLEKQDKGHEILMHTLTKMIDSLDTDTGIALLKNGVKRMRDDWGFRVNGVVGSSGTIADKFIPTVKSLFDYASSQGNTYGSGQSYFTYDNSEPYTLFRYGMQQSTVEEVEAAIDAAVSNTGFCWLYGHAHPQKTEPTDPDPGYFIPENFETIIQYAISKGIEIKTPYEAIKDFYSLRASDVSGGGGGDANSMLVEFTITGMDASGNYTGVSSESFDDVAAALSDGTVVRGLITLGDEVYFSSSVMEDGSHINFYITVDSCTYKLDLVSPDTFTATVTVYPDSAAIETAINAAVDKGIDTEYSFPVPYGTAETETSYATRGFKVDWTDIGDGEITVTFAGVSSGTYDSFNYRMSRIIIPCSPGDTFVYTGMAYGNMLYPNYLFVGTPEDESADWYENITAGQQITFPFVSASQSIGGSKRAWRSLDLGITTATTVTKANMAQHFRRCEAAGDKGTSYLPSVDGNTHFIRLGSSSNGCMCMKDAVIIAPQNAQFLIVQASFNRMYDAPATTWYEVPELLKPRIYKLASSPAILKINPDFYKWKGGTGYFGALSVLNPDIIYEILS